MELIIHFFDTDCRLSFVRPVCGGSVNVWAACLLVVCGRAPYELAGREALLDGVPCTILEEEATSPDELSVRANSPDHHTHLPTVV